MTNRFDCTNVTSKTKQIQMIQQRPKRLCLCCLSLTVLLAVSLPCRTRKSYGIVRICVLPCLSSAMQSCLAEANFLTPKDKNTEGQEQRANRKCRDQRIDCQIDYHCSYAQPCFRIFESDANPPTPMQSQYQFCNPSVSLATLLAMYRSTERWRQRHCCSKLQMRFLPALKPATRNARFCLVFWKMIGSRPCSRIPLLLLMKQLMSTSFTTPMLVSLLLIFLRFFPFRLGSMHDLLYIRGCCYCSFGGTDQPKSQSHRAQVLL